MSDPTEGEEEVFDHNAPASAVDDGQRKRRETAEARKKREDKDMLGLVFASEAGRRLMWSILKECHPFEAKFGFAGPGGFPNSEATFMHLGEQLLGQRLYHAWHQREPANVMLMLHENDLVLKAMVP